MAANDKYKKVLATASLEQAKAMDKAYTDALNSKDKKKKYSYNGLEYAVQPAGTPRVLAADIVSERLKKTPATSTSKTSTTPVKVGSTEYDKLNLPEVKLNDGSIGKRSPEGDTYYKNDRYRATEDGEVQDRNYTLDKGDAKVYNKYFSEREKNVKAEEARRIERYKEINLPETKLADGSIGKIDKKTGDTYYKNGRVFEASGGRYTMEDFDVEYANKLINKKNTPEVDTTVVKTTTPTGSSKGDKVIATTLGSASDRNVNAKNVSTYDANRKVSPEGIVYYDETPAKDIPIPTAAKRDTIYTAPKIKEIVVRPKDNIPVYVPPVITHKLETPVARPSTAIPSSSIKVTPKTYGKRKDKSGQLTMTDIIKDLLTPKDVKTYAYGGSTPKLGFGADLSVKGSNAQMGASMGLQAGSQAINMIDGMDGKPSTLGGVASGAMSGASMGMALGPWGAAGGAVIGGGLALLQAEQAKKEQEKAEKRYMSNLTDQNNFTSQQTLRNYASHGITSSGSYAYGGDLPQYAGGGKPATMQDSLALYNNAIKVDNYYKSRKYEADPKSYFPPEMMEDTFSKLDDDAKRFNKLMANKKEFDTVKVPTKDGKVAYIKADPSLFRKNIDANKFYQRESANSILDTRAPMQLFDRRIVPTGMGGYDNKIKGDPLEGDQIVMSSYDPIGVKPWQMLTPKEKAIRVERYGVPKGVKYKGNTTPDAIDNYIDRTPPIPTWQAPKAPINRMAPREIQMGSMQSPALPEQLPLLPISPVTNSLTYGREVERTPSADPRLANDNAYAKYKVIPKDYESTPARERVKKTYAYGGELSEYGKGGKIHIKPENRGKFTAYKKRTGKTTEEALHSKDPHVRKMANFAKNAKKWKHGDGGELDKIKSPLDVLDYPQKRMMEMITGRYEAPSDALRRKGTIDDSMMGNAAGFAVDALADPMNLLPVAKLKYLKGFKGVGDDIVRRTPDAYNGIKKAYNYGMEGLGAINFMDKAKEKFAYPGGGTIKKPNRVIPAESTGVVRPPMPEMITGFDSIKDPQTRAYLENRARLYYGAPASKEEARLIASMHSANGNPTIRTNPKRRASYNGYENTMYINTNPQEGYEFDDYEAELAHAQQYKNAPITSRLKGIYGRLAYEDSDHPTKGRYGVPGALEQEAHSVIEPQLVQESQGITPKAVGINRFLRELETPKKKYAMGGMQEPEYEVEGGEMIQGQDVNLEQQQQVASDMVKVPDYAPSHAEGGVDGAGGDRVFSDRLKTANKKTYAEEAEKLGKQKAKFEAKIPSTNEAIRNTGERMSERMDMKLDELFNEQEMKKMYAMPSSISSSMAMAYGGHLPKLVNGYNLKGYSVKPPPRGWGLDSRSGRPYNALNNSKTYGNATRAFTTGQFLQPGQTDQWGNVNTYRNNVFSDKGTMYNTDKTLDDVIKFKPPTIGTGPDDLTGLGDTPVDYQQRAAIDNLNQVTAQSNAPLGTPTTPVGGATAKAMKNGNGIPWQYVDNLASGIATANTPQLAKPYMDPAINLNTNYDINPQLSSARNTRDALDRSISASTPQGGASAANRQQLFASYNENANSLYAQKNNVENELKNKEILLNSGINSRNNEKRYAYDEQNVQRRAGIQQDIVGNAQNFAQDQYTSARDAKMDARDLESIKQIAMANANAFQYGSQAGLKAIEDMYMANPGQLTTDIATLEKISPNNPALVNMRALNAKLNKK